MSQEPEPTKTDTNSEFKPEPEKNEYYEKYLRARADFENYQKRTKYEAERTKEETTRKLLFSLLPVWDNFELLAKNTTSDIFNSITNQFLQFFQSNGVTLLDTKIGDPFDSNQHEAVILERLEGCIAPNVGQVFRSGIILNNKIIRPAQVKICTP